MSAIDLVDNKVVFQLLVFSSGTIRQLVKWVTKCWSAFSIIS
ncbi:hypothetical protein Lalb_Chr04g0262941 [Lupinus albus]|uniref:Uncharacterized protein n=1 Tax=Lupinus albus TaxID=3870 RepID=A0A6A4QRV7_LUPAL|nr:hypothetical protein Lalb_Chr04g0262941 [Lupinus albus]